MTRMLPTALIVLIAGHATAQTGTYTWQVSTDGINWGNGVDPLPGTLVHVRLLAMWSGIVGGPQGYAGGQFDVTLGGANSQNPVSNVLRPPPFAFAAQTLVGLPYSGGVKIDTIADTAEPGVGTGWVNPGQAPADFGDPIYTQNPATVFAFDVLSSSNVIIISMVLNPATGRAMAIYNTSAGNQVRMNSSAVTVNSAFIGIPAPGSILLLGMSGCLAFRRQRSYPL